MHRNMVGEAQTERPPRSGPQASLPVDESEGLRSADFQPKAKPPQILEGRLAFPAKLESRAIEAQCLGSMD